MITAGPARRRSLRAFGHRLGLGETAVDACTLLDAALTHDSYAYEHAKGAAAIAMSNERLEFLGDAVLGLIVAAELYKRFPRKPEGELSPLRAQLVARDALAQTAQRLAVGTVLLLGKGEAAAHGESRPRILAAAYEAIVGAAYLTEGFEAARRLVQRTHLKYHEARAAAVDPRTALQEFVQAKFKRVPTYTVTGESGPAHARVFTATVRVRGEVVGTGSGSTKKQAQAQAAAEALQQLRAP